MVSSVEEKMMMNNSMTSEVAPMRNNNNKVSKILGKSGGEIRRFGVSNQKIRRRMG